MKIAGITAEYNPFHAGHKYLFDCIDGFYGDEPHIKLVVMSGNFVQRGEPAIYDKYQRAGEALRNGADIVLEMPTAAALASAEGFAQGAVRILTGCGAERIFFGSESGDKDAIRNIAELLVHEPEAVSTRLKKLVSDGISFPKARAIAVEEYLGDKEKAGLLNSPNDILGIEYTKALIRLKSSACIEPVKRLGQRYNDAEKAESGFPSATALRTEISNNLADIRCGKECNALSRNCPVTANDFSGLLRMKLLEKADLCGSPGINADLFNSLANSLTTPLSFTETIEKVKSKRFTYSAISRALMHLLLEIPEDSLDAYTTDSSGLPYARLLGFRKSATAAIRKMQDDNLVRIITKPAEGKDIPGFLSDVRASRLYNQVVYDIYGACASDEFRQGPQIIV